MGGRREGSQREDTGDGPRPRGGGGMGPKGKGFIDTEDSVVVTGEGS